MQVVTGEGAYKSMGYDLGCKLQEDIKYNLRNRMRDARDRGMDQRQMKKYSLLYMEGLSASSLEMMEGLSQGAGLSFTSILQYNYLQEVFSSESCTTFAAVGQGAGEKGAVLLKNRDSKKQSYKGDDFYKNRNTNVIQILKYPGGKVTVGVATAGAVGVAMGLNRYGVATASNQGYTQEFATLDRESLANYRGQFQQEALEQSSAREALEHVLRRLLQIKPVNPGILWFVDGKEIYILETSPREFSVQSIRDGCSVRSNHFVMLDHLNDEDISSICRYARGNELLNGCGAVTREKLMEFSMDHKNGPGENSICRHTVEPRGRVTESAAIMELNREDPGKSRISISLGSPCHAWRDSQGSLTFQMDEDVSSIPQSFLDGSSFKELIKPEPFCK